MAPAEDQPAVALQKYLEEDVEKTFKAYDKLWEQEDPEETPYKTKYEARKMLEEALKELERRVGEVDPQDSDIAHQGREMIARFMLYLGKNLYFCEEVAGAEKYFNRSLERYLRSPLRLVPKHYVHIQDCFNQLGMLWCQRQNHSEGMNFLRRAQIMFLNRPAAVRETCDEQADNNYTLTMFYLAQAYGGLQKPGLSARFCAETMSRQLDHNASGSRPKEVVERDPFDCKDWVRNCCSLSDFFANECMFWTAEYLLHSAAVMCERCKEICGLVPDSIDELKAEVARDLGHFYSMRLKFARTCAEQPALCEEAWRAERKAPSGADAGDADASQGLPSAGTRLTFACAADNLPTGQEKAPEGGTGPVVWDAVFPEVVHLEDEEAQDNRLAEEILASGSELMPTNPKEGAGGGAARTLLDLSPDDRVRLPVHFAQLHAIVERRIRRANAEFIKLRGPPAVVADLAPPEEEAQEPPVAASASASSSSGRKLPSCAGTSFDTAREIFKLGNRYFIQSVSHFLLDGWVTEHVRILQEISQLYRTLLYWEKDPKRVAAMLVRRIRMLQPLLDQLNPKVFIAFWRQLSYEVAEVQQELFELKANGKLPGSKEDLASVVDEEQNERPPGMTALLAARCNEIAKKSIKAYETFVVSYHVEGKVPEKLEDDDARVYLTARLNKARLSMKMKGLSVDDQVDWHKKSLREYEFILDYSRKHPEVTTKPTIDMATEIRLCEEMVGMLPSKLSRIAAGRRL